MQNRRVPAAVLGQPRGSLAAILDGSEVVLFLREDEWGMRKYPFRECPLELRLGMWEMDSVLLVVLMVRLDRNDGLTFDCMLNVGEPSGVRLVQNLGTQKHVELCLATETQVRTFRVANSFRDAANEIVNIIRTRPAWSREQFQQAGARLSQLYPTSHALWWHAALE
jgi:hypothetical protein